MDADQTIRIKRLADACRAVGESIKSGERTVDADGCPIPGSAFARLHLLLALGYPAPALRRPSKN